MPPATLSAFRDHGLVRASLEEDLDGAAEIIAALAKTGISLKEITSTLLVEGVQLFSEAFEKLLKTVEKQRQ